MSTSAMQRDDKERAADQLAEARLELMPRSVRDKLDRIKIKLHLRDWQMLPMPARERLRDLPCATEAEVTRYAATVAALVLQLTGKPPERLG